MTTALAIKSSDVRSTWAKFVDEVIHNGPKFVQRNERDIFLSMNLDFASQLLEHLRYELVVEHDQEANEYVVSSNNGLWIVESGVTEEEAIRKFLDSFLEWSEDYFEEFNLHYNSPNLKAQFSYVLKAIIIGDVDRLLEYIDVEYK